MSSHFSRLHGRVIGFLHLVTTNQNPPQNKQDNIKQAVETEVGNESLLVSRGVGCLEDLDRD